MAGLLEGRRALVTGGTRGIGRAIAERLRDGGAAVTVTATGAAARPPEGCAYRAVDFGDRDATIAFAKDVEGMDLDILVNNAGTNRVGPFEDYPLDEFERVLRVNLTAPFLLCRAVIKPMKRNRWGRIVNIASLWSVMAKERRSGYTASKFAIDGMTATLAADVAEFGILANCVSPGFIRTDLSVRNLGEAALAELATRVPVRRLGTTEEIAALVAFLAGPENTYITGQNIVIDGGYSRSRG